MKNLIKYGFIAFVISFFTSCSEQVNKKIYLRVYMVDGRSKDVSFVLPVNRSALQVNSSKGSYYLQYVDDRWWHKHWVTVKYGVVDYDILYCR